MQLRSVLFFPLPLFPSSHIPKICARSFLTPELQTQPSLTQVLTTVNFHMLIFKKNPPQTLFILKLLYIVSQIVAKIVQSGLLYAVSLTQFPL